MGKDMTDTPTETTMERSEELQKEYTAALDKLVNGFAPPTLSNQEYAAVTSALMIALNRELARCAAAFGDVWQISAEDMIALVTAQFAGNYAHAVRRSKARAADQLMAVFAYTTARHVPATKENGDDCRLCIASSGMRTASPRR
jgi:hypothetical protein